MARNSTSIGVSLTIKDKLTELAAKETIKQGKYISVRQIANKVLEEYLKKKA